MGIFNIMWRKFTVPSDRSRAQRQHPGLLSPWRYLDDSPGSSF